MISFIFYFCVWFSLEIVCCFIKLSLLGSDLLLENSRSKQTYFNRLMISFIFHFRVWFFFLEIVCCFIKLSLLGSDLLLEKSRSKQAYFNRLLFSGIFLCHTFTVTISENRKSLKVIFAVNPVSILNYLQFHLFCHDLNGINFIMDALA